MSDDAGRKGGRPRKGEPPRIPYRELDRILVFGEVVPGQDRASTTVAYPSYRELAKRYGVSHSLVAQYAKKHNCMRRRHEAQARVAARVDQKLIELRASAIAMSKADAIRIIDNYLVGFEKALVEGRVRFDNPSDLNTMLRLKEFLQGGADSRQEIHTSISLADIQARHRRMQHQVETSSPALRGEVVRNATRSGSEHDRTPNENAPAPTFETAAEKVRGRTPGERNAVATSNAAPAPPPPRAPERAAGRAALASASSHAEGEHTATAAPEAPGARASSPEEHEP